MPKYHYKDGRVNSVEKDGWFDRNSTGRSIKAHAKLGAMVIDPRTYKHLYDSNKRNEGFVLPGARYIGPGNSTPDIKKGSRAIFGSDAKDLPKSRGDYYAYMHDNDYEDYLNKGYSEKEVYGGFSDADQRLMDRAATDPYDTHSLAAWYGMGAKKLLNKTGMTATIRDKDR